MPALRFLLLAAAVALSLPARGFAQNLAVSADRLQYTLRALSSAVDDHVPREEGRKDIQSAIDKARGDLGDIRDLASRGASRESIRDHIVKVREHLNDTWQRLGGQTSRDSLRDLVANARYGLARLDGAWVSYGAATVIERRPGFNPPPPPPPAHVIPVSRQTWARGLAINHLAGYFRVPPATLTATTVERAGDHFRVLAGNRRLGYYLVDLNADTGRVYSARPTGPR